MKKNYPRLLLTLFTALIYSFSSPLFAQTSPDAQELPYTQSFDDLASTATTYPSGFQGWTASTSPSSSYTTTGTLVADRSLTASSSASTTSGNVHNYDGKIGFLNTSSLDIAIGFALNTTGKSAITVQYDAMVIRNPYDGSSNTRISEMALQYRVGTTADFTTLSASSYLSETTKQTTGTSPLNSQTISVYLPSECDNQSVVQIRWICKQNSGSGSRPSFAIDNISIQNDLTPPVDATDYPKIDNILSDSFDFSTQIDKIGQTYYVLLNDGSTTPSIAQIKAGLDASGNAALQSGIISITDASLVYTKTITDLDLGTSYTIYAVSEDAYGNTQTETNQLDVTTSSTLVPSITPAISSLNLGFAEQNFTSDSMSYSVEAKNLSGDITLNATGNFTISKESDANFQTSIVFEKADFDLSTSQTVYVRFTPNATGSFSGQITHESLDATSKTISLSGTGIDPYTQDFNETTVLSNSGWTAYSVTGDNVSWASTTIRYNSSPGAVLINGYTEDGASDDWLISPRLRLDNFSDFPILSFYSRKYYSGSTLKLMVSVDYDGVSNPETANWTTLDGDFPTTTAVFKESNYINLQDYKTDHTYLAWVYQTTTNDSNNSAEWTVDDVSISNETSFIASGPSFDFGEVAPNASSTSQSFEFKAGGYGDFTLSVPSEYQLSTDDSTFQSSVNVTEAEALAGKTIYVEFAPSTKALSTSEPITITATDLNEEIGTLTGSSWLKSVTFDIVTYNLEFFGSDVVSTSGDEFGPTDDDLQIENVATVMNTLNADVYVVQEVSDETALESLIEKISINGKVFDKTISPAWSYSFNDEDPNFPPQKLVVLYDTQTTTVKSSRVMFSDLYDDIRAGNTTLTDYPEGSSSSFFASGRLPYMVEIETNINGVKKELTLIDLHARANSGTDITKYNMRKYDVEVLKDSLDAHYPNANLILLGDYNDDVKTSVIDGYESSYVKFVEDTANYDTLTLTISNEGAYSYLSYESFLDHIISSNELSDEYIANSTAVYDPQNDISSYTYTTSDHGPVIARFDLKEDTLGTSNTTAETDYSVKTYPNPTTDIVNIIFNNNTNKATTLTLYNMNGKSIGQTVTNEGNTSTISYDVSQLQSGIYIYSLSQDNKVIYSNKFIKN
jgi:hypothetical protein